MASIAFSGEKSTFGNKAVAIGTVTLTDQASGAVQVLGYIDGAVINNKAQDANQTWTVAYNAASGGTSTEGYLQIKSAASGDVFSVFVWGRP